MSYLLLKNSHAGLAIVSVTLFIWRAMVSINYGHKPSLAFRVVAHAIDTLLLVLGATLAYMLALNPFTTVWFGLKLVAIVLYVSFGIVVMRSESKRVKGMAFVLSLLVVIYIFFLAINKHPLISASYN